MAAKKLSAEMLQQINELGQRVPRLSNRDIANILGIHNTTVMDHRVKAPGAPLRGKVKSPQAEAPKMTETHEQAGDTWTVSLPRTRICTLDELVDHCKIDLKEWEVERFVCNKWEVGAADKVEGRLQGIVVEPLFQVKAFLRKRRFESTEGYIEENARLRTQVAKMQISIGREKEMAKRLARNHAGYDDLLDNMRALKASLGDFKLSPQIIRPAVAKIKPAVKPGHTEDAVLLLSDTHFGEKHRREDVSGFQVCDSVILANRLGSVTASAKEVLAIQRAAYPIKTLYIWFGGDIGNGELHSSERSNDLMMTEQVHFSYYMLKFVIEDLLALTVPDEHGNVVVENIVLLFTVGNHMRIDEKMPHDLQARRTFDWLIYQFLIEHFGSNPKVTIRKEMSPFIFETIRGWRHLFCHGMQIGYKNSPDAQSKSVSDFMKLARALFDSPQWREENGFQGETFARVCGGDIHVPVSFPRYKGNGSLPGQNSLGVNWQLEPIPAGQQIFGVTESRLETWSYFLDVTKVQRSEADMNDYGRYAVEYLERTGRS